MFNDDFNVNNKVELIKYVNFLTTSKILNSCCFYIKCKRNQACPICKCIVQVCHTLFYDSVKFISDVKSSDHRIISKFIISQRMQIEGLLLYGFVQGQLQEWTEHSKLIFENLKPVENSKNNFSII